MAQSQAKIAAGTQLRLGDGASPEVFTKIAEVTQVSEIGETTPEIDAARQFIGGLAEGNAVSFTLSYVATNTAHKALRDANGSAKNFEIEWVDGSKASFTLVITSFMRGETTAEGVLTASLEGRISGGVTYTDPT